MLTHRIIPYSVGVVDACMYDVCHVCMYVCILLYTLILLLISP